MHHDEPLLARLLTPILIDALTDVSVSQAVDPLPIPYESTLATGSAFRSIPIGLSVTSIARSEYNRFENKIFDEFLYELLSVRLLFTNGDTVRTTLKRWKGQLLSVFLYSKTGIDYHHALGRIPST